MQDVIVFGLREEYEDLSGGNVSLVDGDMYDVGEALEEGDGRIVLGPGARLNEDEEVLNAEAERAWRDGQIADALKNYPALEQVEATSDDIPPSFDAVDVSLGSGPSKSELRDRASELDIPGRSSMSKEQLAEAIAAEEARLASTGEEPGSAGEVTDGQPVDDEQTTTGEGGVGDGEASTEGSGD